MIKNIINWTCGGFFRALGRVLCFIAIGTIVVFLLMSNGFKMPSWLTFGLVRVNAATVNYTYKKYRIQFYSLSQGTSAWTSVEDFGTRQPFSSGYGVSGVSARFGWSSKFQAGTTYRLTLDWGVAPLSARSNYAEVSSFSCYGSTSTSNWSADASLIATCNLVGTSLVPNGGAIRYMFDITPLQTVIGLQVNAFSGHTDEITGANVYTSSTITYGEDATGAINDQTIIMQDEFENITNIINENNQNLINAITEENQVCEVIDKNNTIQSGYLTSNGDIASSTGFKITDYIKIDNKTKITMLETYTIYNTPNICFYNINKSVISCLAISSISQNETINIPNNSSYIRISVNNDLNRPQVKICKNGNQATLDVFTDTDVSSDTNSIYNQLHDFNLSIEGPLSQILMVPINLLETLLIDYNDTATHPGLCFTLRGVESCIPSGDIIWKRTASGYHDNYWFGIPNYTNFRSFFELVAGGFLVYMLLKKLVHAIEKGLDPTISEVNIINL